MIRRLGGVTREPPTNKASGVPARSIDSRTELTLYSESRASSLLSSVRNYQFENGRRYHGYREGSECEMRAWVVRNRAWLMVCDRSIFAAQ